MKNLNKKLLIFVLFGLIALLAACGGSEESSGDAGTDTSDAEFTIRNPIMVSEQNFVSETMKKFKELVEEKTDGRVKVENYFNGSLASSDEEAYQMVTNGNAEVFGMSSFVGAQASGVDALNIYDFPFVFGDRHELYGFAEGEVGQAIFDEFEEATGTKVLGTYDIGFYAFLNSSHPIEKPEDFEGLTIRTPESSMYMDLVETMGGNPTPITHSEVYTALQQGTIDGVTTTLPLMLDSQFHEVGEYITVTAHSFVPYVLTMNGDFYNSLPEDLQVAVEEAAQEMVEFSRDFVSQKEVETVEDLEANGIEVHELTEEEFKIFQEAVQPAVEKNMNLVGEETYQEIIESLE